MVEDLTLATLNGKLIEPKSVPNLSVPVYQYESIFRTKEILEDRYRFAKAWFNYFGEYGGRGRKALMKHTMLGITWF